MLNLKILMGLSRPAFAKRLLYVFLILALVPIVDCILIIEMARLCGEYLFLAILVFLSLAGFFLSVRVTSKLTTRIKDNLKSNIFSLNNYRALPGSLIAAFLLIMPGIISSVIGLFCSIPYARTAVGAKISDFLKLDWREIHEYMSIID